MREYGESAIKGIGNVAESVVEDIPFLAQEFGTDVSRSKVSTVQQVNAAAAKLAEKRKLYDILKLDGTWLHKMSLKITDIASPSMKRILAVGGKAGVGGAALGGMQASVLATMVAIPLAGLSKFAEYGDYPSIVENMARLTGEPVEFNDVGGNVRRHLMANPEVTNGLWQKGLLSSDARNMFEAGAQVEAEEAE